jgi:hypothetical protein
VALFRLSGGYSRIVNDKRLELAVNAGLANLKQQDATLRNLRNRAAGILTTAALVTAFAGSLGLVGKEQFPRWAALLLLVVLVLIGMLAIAVQWPTHGWAFGLDPQLILGRIDQGDDEDKLHRYLAGELKTAMSCNSQIIHRCGILYRIAAGLLVIEMVILTIGLFIR